MMIVECRVGTPDEQEVKTYRQPGDAKKFIRGRMNDRVKWAERFSHETKRRLVAAREEFDQLDLRTIPKGETRQWQVTDEYTGVRFIYRIKVVQK